MAQGVKCFVCEGKDEFDSSEPVRASRRTVHIYGPDAPLAR